MQDFEKLGVFYLGREFDLSAKKPLADSLVLYDSKDLVTHAVCVGMTGSGKTGLCISVLEEAAIDGIPAIVIDPKGDLANLLLAFPDLKPQDFEPWVNADDARQKGLSAPEFAAQQAEAWKKGLSDWGQEPERIRRLKAAADFAIYTPGSNAGIGVSILRSFSAPEPAVREDGELFRERIATTATSLLGLLDIDADPIQSRQHILISTILGTAWQQGQDLDLAQLIGQIQQPPVERVGVMDLDSFFPAKERFALAMRLNNLLAAPGFSAWLEGEPLDIQQILYSPQGKPRIAIFSIAHLGDPERMFFVSMLLNQVLGWMRQQPGTTSLRAIVYMDEIFGYFPPTANPPSKQPLLTLMKQARAFGVGVMLATQNPVDLDYKGLSNAGTWFIGRLQTERDKARLLDGLEGAAAGQGQKFDRGRMEETLAGLGSRVFLMNNVHEDAPVVFQSRWALSYLRGPMTRNQIKQLMDPVKEVMGVGDAGAGAAPGAAGSAAGAKPASGGRAADRPVGPAAARGARSAAPAPAPVPLTGSATVRRPVLAPEIQQLFLPIRANPSSPAQATLAYEPMLLGCATVYFSDAKTGINHEQAVSALTPVTGDVVPVDWAQSQEVEWVETDLEREPEPAGVFAALPPTASRAKSYDLWKKSFVDWLYRGRQLELFRSPSLKLVSNPGESERDFRVRLQQSAREERDARVEKLRQKYMPKVNALQERKRRAQHAVDREREQASAAGWGTAISVGSTVLGALFGRKTMTAGTIGRATTAARGASRTYKERQDITRAGENVEAIDQQLADLNAQFMEEATQLSAAHNPMTEELETVALKPKKTNISVRTVVLAWAPYWQAGEQMTPAWE
ncbi:MAG TPA: hypothetical protein VER17_03640 [Tepidisphaeraceae bacterium]|nr:hypothetical protein [Tepidisphaeraceae bacterium]